MQNYIYDILKEDYDAFLHSIVENYGELGNFTYKDLSNNFPLEKIIFYKKKLIKFSKPREKNFIPPDRFRCNARVWGGPTSVRKINNKWCYGHRCSRYKIHKTNYCKTHLKTLPHGDFDKNPPHNHYNKFKQQI